MNVNDSKKTGSKTIGIIIGVVVILIILAGIGWFVFMNPGAQGLGMRNPAVPMNPNGMQMGSTTPGGRYGGSMRGAFTTGSIEVLNDNGFTLTLSDGTTKDVTLSATTTIQNYASASSTPTTITPDQLSVGEQVLVIGAPNADGSITARTVRTGNFPVRASGSGRGGMRAGATGGTAPTQ